jgi:dimethylaniline monooxygenase (N-oxide forming)
MKIAIIGGGPSGLVTLKHLATAHEYFSGLEPITIRLFDSRKEIGGTFRYGTYRDSEVSNKEKEGVLNHSTEALQLVSSKYLTTFSDHRFPANAPDFATPEFYLSYLHGYVAKFGLQKYIECSTCVIKVSRAENGGHVVKIRKLGNMPLGDVSVDSSPGPSDIPAVPVPGEEDWNCDAVVVCSGLNRDPNVPDLPGLESLKQKLDANNKVCTPAWK